MNLTGGNGSGNGISGLSSITDMLLNRNNLSRQYLHHYVHYEMLFQIYLLHSQYQSSMVFDIESTKDIEMRQYLISNIPFKGFV